MLRRDAPFRHRRDCGSRRSRSRPGSWCRRRPAPGGCACRAGEIGRVREMVDQRRYSPHRQSLGFALFAVAAPVAAAEVLVLSGGAAQSPLNAALPAFESTLGAPVKIAFAPAGEIAKRVAAGEVFDLLIMPAENVDAYEKQGKVVPGSRGAARQGRNRCRGQRARAVAGYRDARGAQAGAARGEVGRLYRPGARHEREAFRGRARSSSGSRRR